MSCHQKLTFSGNFAVEVEAGDGGVALTDFAAGVAAGTPMAFFLSEDFRNPLSRASIYAFRRKQADTVRSMSVMNRPSTVAEGGERVIMPLTKIQATPARGTRARIRESTRITTYLLFSFCPSCRLQGNRSRSICSRTFGPFGGYKNFSLTALCR